MTNGKLAWNVCAPRLVWAEAPDAAKAANTAVFASFIFLKSNAFYSRSQSEYPHFFSVLPIGDEFRERIVFCGTHEKFRKCLAQGICHDKFRWRNAGTNGSQPGAERVPNELGGNDSEILEQPLGDNAGLHESMIGVHFAFDTVSIIFRRAM